MLARSAASFAPDWALGAALGVGGLAGAYVGARLQARCERAALRRLLGVVTLALAIRYAAKAIF